MNVTPPASPPPPPLPITSPLSLYQPCPPGLRGDDCSQAACNSTFQEPDERFLASNTSLTGCSTCADGFRGINCNVCFGAQSCASLAKELGVGANNSSNPAVTSTSSALGQGLALSTLSCHAQPRVVPSSVHYGECSIDNPTLSSVFPGAQFTIAITKVGNDGPGDFAATGLAPWDAKAASALSSVFLDGKQQFYCQASSCSASNTTTAVSQPDAKFGTDNWTCQDLACHCIPGTTFCSKPGLQLDKLINGLDGNLSLPCDYGDPANPSARTTCAFKSATIMQFLGANGLRLNNCLFGGCVSQSALQTLWSQEAEAARHSVKGSSKLSGKVAGAISAVAILIALVIALLMWGLFLRRRAMGQPRQDAPGALGLRWTSIEYKVRSSSGLRRREVPHKDSSTIELQDIDEDPEVPNDTGDTTVLHPMGGECEPGSLTALMGASGAGKSSLVEILAGKAKDGLFRGSIHYTVASGALLGEPNPCDQRTLAFVDQDDALPGYLTVREALEAACQLALPENRTREERARIINDVLTVLGLIRVQHRLIGSAQKRGLSGGERRRVSIGCALVGRPRLLILDEPLSGLDAMAASAVMDLLRNLASGAHGTTILLTIHQPSSDLFMAPDHVMVLAHGHVVFDGVPEQAIDFCSRRGINLKPGQGVAETLLHLTKDGPESAKRSRGYSVTKSFLETGRESSVSGKRIIHEGVRTQVLTQVMVLCRRLWLQTKREPTGALAHILGAVILGLFTGGAFFQVKLTIGGFQNRVGSMFFTLLLLAFSALSAVTGINAARTLMERERGSGMYGPLPWLVSHVAFDLFFLRVIPAVILTIIIYWMVGLAHDAARFFEFMLITIVFACDAGITNAILGVLFRNLSTAILCASLLLIFQLGFAGFLLNVKTLPKVLRWLSWLCPIRYALEAVGTNELEGLSIVDNLSGVAINTPVSLVAPGLFGFTDNAYYRNLLVLALGFLLAHLLILGLAVHYLMRERR
ncbi:Transporter, ABC superfamily (Breast cancer resistance protein) [Ceraceosorus bombacis]|uniref:Transporter, ABC superfamily (Breast cancer resistance protein) n=1 Tax=Ceraceosorus bombacis TaxID=401625 RepID=A0A0P1B9M6_9BASI|nr:Transporter, ABC superfamily (Breast cancer resistance protein) [Ceraceosorus bombacis]